MLAYFAFQFQLGWRFLLFYPYVNSYFFNIEYIAAMHYSMPSCNNPVVHIVYFYWERGAGLNKTPKQMSSWRFIGSGAELTACFYWQQNCVETTRHFFCVSTHCARSPLHSISLPIISRLRATNPTNQCKRCFPPLLFY